MAHSGLAVLILLLSRVNGVSEYIDYVNPFIGTEGTVPGTAFNGGNTFPGATEPFGTVKIGPDTTSFNQSIGQNAGYTPDGNVTAFSLTHVSGTGGGPVYGVVSQMPLVDLTNVNVLDNLTYMEPRVGNDTARVGYYKTTFRNGIVTELSATKHAGFLQYTFPNGTDRQLLVDVSHYLPLNTGYNQAQFYSNGDLEISSNMSRYVGSGVFRGGFSHVPNYRIFFCGEFDQTPVRAAVFEGPYTDPYWPGDYGAQAQPVNASYVSGGPAYYNYGKRVGSVFTFDTSVDLVKSRIGVSFKSTDNACKYLNDEIPHWNFTRTVRETQNTWTNTLSTISTTDRSNDTRLQMFYTALYHTHLMPTDRSGDNANWDAGATPSYDDYYTLWDTFRCLNSLYILICPNRATGIVNSLIDIWRHEQFMPDGRSGNANGQVQGGSNSDNVLADAFIKDLPGIDWTEAYRAMKTNAELTPPNNYDTGDPTGSTIQGRGALPDWIQYGYLTPDYDRSVSRTVEYALNDFSLSQVASQVAPEDKEKYLRRSAGWQYQWQSNLTSLNFTGFVAPLYANKSRDPSYDPAVCAGFCEFGGYTYEALGWEYSWTLPFDMETLISLMGGPSTFEKRLDTMFIPGLRSSGVGAGGQNGIGTTLFNPGNEPSFSTPFLYNYVAGKQHKSVQRSREITNLYYNNGRSGLPGNSDAGALDSWLIWQMIGLYPVVTQPVYLILAPMFSNYQMKVGINGDKVLNVTAENLSDESFYVQNLKVNGKDWHQSWLNHSDIVDGGTLEFVLGNEPVSWDTGDVPPSPGHYTLQK